MVTVGVSLFGLTCLASFFNRLSHLGPDDWFMLAFGVALISLAVLFARFTLLPHMIIDDERLMFRRFFGSRELRWHQVQSLSAYTLWVHPRDRKGRRIQQAQPIMTKRLSIETDRSKTHTLTLPHLGGNDSLLALIEARSGLKVRHLEDQSK